MKAFIVVRDRVTYARQCTAAMTAAGLEPVLVDHGSTWPEAVTWLADQAQEGILVVPCGGGHPRDLQARDWFPHMTGLHSQYVVTDPDVIPSEGCPLDWPQHLADVLDRYPGYHKAGLGLRIDRIPEHYSRRNDVIGWEAHFWDQQLSDGVYLADIDTTLALHVPLAEVGCHSYRAVRTGFPYVADHVAWYEDYANLTPELRYYHDHAEPGISCWTPSPDDRGAWGELA